MVSSGADIPVVMATRFVIAHLRKAFQAARFHHPSSHNAYAHVSIPWQIYEHAMDPMLRAKAKVLWGEDLLKDGTTPRWLHRCRQAVGFSMKQFVTTDRGV